MNRHLTTMSCAIAWLLCALLACIAIHSPHCDLCDGPYFPGSSSQSTFVNHTVHDTPECNGICSCCGFHGLPNVFPALHPVNTQTTATWSKPSAPVLASRSPIFRPPRIVISS